MIKRFFIIFVILLYGCIHLEKKIDDDSIKPIINQTINIASFNIQIFGKAKVSNPYITSILATIITNFDIIAIQEIRDSSGITMPTFLDIVNSNSKIPYNYIISDRLGRSTSKEQYVFLYNSNIIYCSNSYIYNDTNDIFEREPFIAQFKANKFDFILVNIHTKPSDAEKEIQELTNVIIDINNKITNDNDIIILGDLNADGSYFSEKITNGLRDKKYNWIITDTFDTTLASGDNTYDRIVIQTNYTSEDFIGKRGVFKFKHLIGTNIELKKISDHYPVWAKFYTDRDSD